MKTYEKQYEDVYSNPLKLKKCLLSEVTTDIGLNAHEYISSMKKFIWKFEMDLFDNLVKYFWLSRRFYYKGEQRLRYFGNGHSIDSAYGVLLKHYVGTSRVMFTGKSIYKVLTYLKEFYPDLDKRNPFEEKIEYPFKHIGLSYLTVVHQMDDRMDFLNYAEKHKLRYTEFLDYMINHVYSANAESDKPIYIWSYLNFNLPVVSVISKNKHGRVDATMSKEDEEYTKQRAKKYGEQRATADAERIARWKQKRENTEKRKEEKQELREIDRKRKKRNKYARDYARRKVKEKRARAEEEVKTRDLSVGEV